MALNVKFVKDLIGKVTGKKEEEEAKVEGQEGDEKKPEDKGNNQEILTAILEKLKEITENFNSQLSQFDGRLKAVEAKLNDNEEYNELKDKISKLEKTLDEFSAVYEMISNQYNPFIEAKPSQGKNESKEEGGAQVEEVLASKQDSEKGKSESPKDKEKSEKYGQEEDEEGKKKVSNQEKDSDSPKVGESESKPEEPGAQDSVKGDDGNKKKVGSDKSASKLKDGEDAKESVDETKEKKSEEENYDYSSLEIEESAPEEEEDIEKLIESKKDSKVLQKKVESDKLFHPDGHDSFSSLFEMVTLLHKHQYLFDKHVGENMDHFSDWVEHALDMKELADELRTIKDRKEYIKKILSFD